MTRRSSTSPRPARPRRAASPPRRIARGQTFTTLGFAFFRLVSIDDREPGEPRYAVIRLREPRRAMAAFAAAS
ncbi:MAG TPA: hypothetical protein VK932_23855 [Kofleriaceae bacterium]|nr:hypothetical protein [Kofleriaceae bacterium]